MTPLAPFAEQSAVTSPGRHALALNGLPVEVPELVNIIQRLVVYDLVAHDFYGYAVPPDRQDEIHIRTVESLLDRLFALDQHPLTTPRATEKRVIGRCHHFTWLLIAALRARNVPARARCGFGSYFNPPWFEDHWVCEYWNAAGTRWVLVDSQFDEIWRERLKIDHDILDVPRNRFLVAGEAWERCRSGELDARKLGIGRARVRLPCRQLLLRCAGPISSKSSVARTLLTSCRRRGRRGILRWDGAPHWNFRNLVRRGGGWAWLTVTSFHLKRAA
jgi:hypothetical protein